MSTAKTLALLNCIIVTINFSWIILIDNSYFFGHSINSAISEYPTYLTPDAITFKIWSFLAANMILVGILMYIASKNEQENIRTLKKVEKIGNLLLLNQLFCGMSMVLKLNDQFILSVLCSVGCLITILLINRKIQIHKLVSNSITRYFIRLGFGVYTGWMIVIAAFNSVIIVTKYDLISNSIEMFGLNLAILVAATIYSIYYTISHNLPAVSVVMAWGVFGILLKNINSPFYIQPDMKPYLFILLAATVLSSAYSFYRCNVRRGTVVEFNENPPSIS